MSEKHHAKKRGVSLILRLAVASLLIGAAIPKFMGGLGSTAAYFQTIFKDTWLPMPLVKLHGMLTPFLEAGIAVWLLSGVRLKQAWIVAALFMISLAFGMVVVKQYDTAAHNYFYVLICCAGLYFSPSGCCSADGKKESCHK